jgi:hypothetical protein
LVIVRPKGRDFRGIKNQSSITELGFPSPTATHGTLLDGGIPRVAKAFPFSFCPGTVESAFGEKEGSPRKTIEADPSFFVILADGNILPFFAF